MIPNILFGIMKRQNKTPLPVRFRTLQPEVSGKFALPVPAGIDRRVARTQVLLRQSLFSLMGEKDYDALTVNDILKRADIGRSTFYAHFCNKDELLRSGLAMFQAWILEAQRQAKAAAASTEVILGFTPALFEHMHEQRELYRRLVARPGGAVIVQRELQRIFSEVVRGDLAAHARRGSTTPETFTAVVAMISGALFHFATTWLTGPSKLSARDADALFRSFVFPGLRAVLDVSHAR